MYGNWTYFCIEITRECGRIMKQEKVKTPEELAKEQLKYEIAEELGLLDKVQNSGWKALTAKETGRIGGLMTRRWKAMQTKEDSTGESVH